MAAPICDCGTCRKCRHRACMQRAREKQVRARAYRARWDGFSLGLICHYIGLRLSPASSLDPKAISHLSKGLTWTVAPQKETRQLPQLWPTKRA